MKPLLVPFVPFVLSALLLSGCPGELVCPAGETACGDRCVDLLSDPRNCGTCGAVVGPLEACVAGTAACRPEAGSCGGRCVDLARDADHCGACDVACAPDQLCVTGAGASSCAGACPAGLAACGRACVDLAADRFHCGACGSPCAAGQACRDGACRADLAVACYATSEVVPVTAALAPAGDPLPTPAGPSSIAFLGGLLYAANVDGFSAAYLSALPLDPASPPRHLPLSGWDLQQAAPHGNVLLVTNATVSSLLLVDPSLTVLDEVAMPGQQTAPNPHGFAVAGTSAYVALYGGGATNGQAIARVDLSGLAACASAPGSVPCGVVSGEIDLLGRPGAADAPGLPFPSAVASVGGRVYVTLSNLAEDATPFGNFYVKPAGSGKLAVVDPAAGDAVSILPLPGCGNPGAVALSGTTLWVSCGSFSYPDLAPSGLVPVNVGASPPAAGAFLPLPAIVPGKVAFCGGLGYVTDQASGAVVRFDPATRIVEDPAVVCPTGPYGFAWAADVACSE